MKKMKEFLENGKWKQMKKSDWVVLALTGVLLLVIALPAGEKGNAKKGGDAGGGDGNLTQSEESGAAGFAGQEEKRQASGGEQGSYVEDLEKKLEAVLAQVDGVGRVEVMITIADAGEHVVEKDSSRNSTTTSETDSGGGSRTVTETGTSTAAIFVETQDETYPYVQKEKMPTIEGVVVVAEGGGNSSVIAAISETIKALFPVEAHRIKVVKMCSREETK